MELAESLGMGGLIVVNLFAYRSIDPRELIAAAEYRDVVGKENDAAITRLSPVRELRNGLP
nr:DUF1643 domain-containing protein [Methylocystis sp. Sn-Cys]